MVDRGVRLPRYVALWIPNWELNALVVDVPVGAPAAVVHHGRVAVVTPSAFRLGVRVGMRQVMAQYHCADLLIFPPDDDRESAAFEVILQVFDDFAPGVVAVKPGLAFALARGPAKWAGGEGELASELAEQVALQTGAECQVGIADSLAGALLAARQGAIVPPSETGRFLGQQQLLKLVEDLPPRQRREVGKELPILAALGIHTVGQLRELGADPLLTRFGASGQALWRLATGEGELAQITSRNVGEVGVEVEVDPPALSVDQALFAVRRAANSLSDLLVQRGLYSSTVRISIERSGGVVSERTWTLLDAMSSSQVGKRITWQLKGMSDASSALEGSADDNALRWIRVTALYPAQIPDSDPLWGGGQSRRKAGLAVEEVQALLGEESAVLPIIHGGFDPRSRSLFQSWGAEVEDLPPRSGPWEGSVASPPIILFEQPPSALLMGERKEGTTGRIWVNRRGFLNGNPRYLILSTDHPELPSGNHPLSETKGLWMVRGRWWNPENKEHAPRCYLRVSRTGAPDLLLVQRGPEWWVEGVYATAEIHR